MKIIAILGLITSSLTMAQFKAYDDFQKKAPSLVYSSEELLIGGQPSYEELEYLKSKGLKVVINLRQNGESDELSQEEMWVKKLGLEYIRLPLSGSDINVSNSKKLAQLLAGKKNVLLHCASGNRVGGLLAIDAFSKAHGTMSVDEALSFGRQRGMKSLENHIKSQLESIQKN